MKPDCPCKTCPDQGCGEKHSSCEPYQAWKEEWKKQKADIPKHFGIYNERYGKINRKGGKWQSECDKSKYC